jgi:hypothetical protein
MQSKTKSDRLDSGLSQGLMHTVLQLRQQRLAKPSVPLQPRPVARRWVRQDELPWEQIFEAFDSVRQIVEATTEVAF